MTLGNQNNYESCSCLPNISPVIDQHYSTTLINLVALTTVIVEINIVYQTAKKKVLHKRNFSCVSLQLSDHSVVLCVHHPANQGMLACINLSVLKQQ